MQIFSSICFLSLATVFFIETSASQISSHFPPSLRSNDIPFEWFDNDRAEISKDVLNYRLPNDTYPEHYDVILTTKVHDGQRPFQGKVIIDIVVAKDTSSIVLHARQLEISSVTITNLHTAHSEEMSKEYEKEREFLILSRTSKEIFLANTKWKLIITYNGTLRDDNGGFYMSTYIDDTGKDRYLATTQFESTNARHAFPCYDEPAKRANFTITIMHDPKYSAISNMPVNDVLSSDGKTVFLTTGRISTYIVAFIVSDFEASVGTLNKLPHRVYSRPNAKHTQEWALVSSMLITQRLAEYYGVEFMIPKLDHVAIPDFAAGGMENWGLATYREEYLLYDKDTSSVFTQTSVANVVAHEICHQWFGDFVAIKWWSYLWLKEGFATLFSYKALDDAYPEWGVWQQFHANDYQNALSVDGGDSPRPMTYYVQTPRDISNLYDSVSYGKAGSVLYMWNNAVTDKVFQKGLHNYLTKNQYKAAVEEDLFTAIQNAAKEENYGIPATISEMMGSWSRQGGYPILTVTRNYEDGTFTVTQEAFHNNENLKDSKTWYVPINYAAASKADFRDTEATHYLLNVKEIKIDAKIAKNDWLMVNKQSAYYYRIKYDDDNYKLITESLLKRPSKIHARNRAQLMNDAFRLSMSNRLDHATLLKMMSYLKKEDQYAPWATASSIIKLLDFYLRGDSKYDDLKFFIADQIGPIYDKLGINDIPGEQHYQKYTRNIIINLACLAGVKDCVEETNRKLNDLIENNTPIEPNLQSAIYCNGLKESTDLEFYYLYDKLMDSTDQALRRAIISDLGCAQNKSHIMKFISSSIDTTNKLRIQERYTLLSPVYSRGEAGLLSCIEFLSENWDEYANLEGGFGGVNPLNVDIQTMAYYVVSKKQEEKLLALVAQVKDSKHVSSNIETYVKGTISSNFNWLANNRNPIMSWITKYRFEQLRSGSVALTSPTKYQLFACVFIMALIHIF